MNWFTQAAKDSLAEMAIINLINLPISLGIGYYLAVSVLAVFGLVVLLEATALMFIGGAMDLSMSAGSAALAKLLNQKPDKGLEGDVARRKRFRRAVVFVMTGVFLLAESLALALPFV